MKLLASTYLLGIFCILKISILDDHLNTFVPSKLPLEYVGSFGLSTGIHWLFTQGLPWSFTKWVKRKIISLTNDEWEDQGRQNNIFVKNRNSKLSCGHIQVAKTEWCLRSSFSLLLFQRIYVTLPGWTFFQ